VTWSSFAERYKTTDFYTRAVLSYTCLFVILARHFVDECPKFRGKYNQSK